LLSEGKIRKAELLMKRTVSGVPDNMRNYQTLGQIIIEMGPAMSLAQIGSIYPNTGNPFPHDYERQLDLETATASVSYTYDNVTYSREAFISAPANALIIRFRANKPGALTFHVKGDRGQFPGHAGRFLDNIFRMGSDTIGYEGMSGGEKGIGFCCMMKAASVGGKVHVLGEYLCVEGADEAVLYLSAATTYRYAAPKAECEKRLNAVAGKKYSELYEEHLTDYQALYNRCSLNLEGNSERDNLPTDLRLSAYRDAGGNDPRLEALLFHYGRYLLISSSRPGSLPANLQGIWCYEFAPAWDSKYTININTEMNYWAAETCNLSELHLPLFTLMEKMYPNGVKTAEKMYGCKGWMAHHNTDLWGDTAPQDTYPPATYWMMGAAWLATHIWTHYHYSLDAAFLKKYFPLMREACVFLLDFMLEDEKGRLIIFPTSSPENTYRLPNGELGELCMGCTMDSQIIRRLFEDTISADEIVGADKDFVQKLQAALKKLPPTQIGPDGRIMEWLEPYEELEPGHRHISQLYGLYPGDQISPFTTPELIEAARKTIELRLKNGGGHTGWSRVWLILFWARLWNGEKAGG
jgi:alpha-L-fucosidase 2